MEVKINGVMININVTLYLYPATWEPVHRLRCSSFPEQRLIIEPSSALRQWQIIKMSTVEAIYHVSFIVNKDFYSFSSAPNCQV